MTPAEVMAMKKVKLPKRIAGVKVPKELRKSAERAIARAQSPAGREMIAAGLSMAAAAASAAVVRARTEREAQAAGPRAADGQAPVPPDAPVPPVPPVPPRGTTKEVDPAKVVDAVSQVAEQVLGQIFGRRRS